MEDDYQKTLKGKIKILYQLEKWQDVHKLTILYMEKYGKEAEIDLMRFKSEKHLGTASTEPANQAVNTAPKKKDSRPFAPTRISTVLADDEQPLLLTANIEAEEHPAMLIINDMPAKGGPQSTKGGDDYEPFPQANELIINDAFAKSEYPPVEDKMDFEPFLQGGELVLTDPFVENEPAIKPRLNPLPESDDEPMIVDPSHEDDPVLSLDYNEPPPAANTLLISGPVAKDEPEPVRAPGKPAATDYELIFNDPANEAEPVFIPPGNESPLILGENRTPENVQIPYDPQSEELAIVQENPEQPADAEISFEVNEGPSKAFDADPELDPAHEVKTPAAESFHDEEARLPAEPLDADALISERPADVWQMPAAEETRENLDEKPQLLRETDTSLLRKLKATKKFNFNFKYLLVLVLPLTAAVVLWLALSGKLGLDGDEVAKENPVTVSEPRPAPLRKPVRREPPAVQAPKTDDTEQRVNEKVIQAKKFLKNNDVLNALAVVLEAKKIKITEPLSELEAQITKKMRDDEARANEQKELELKIAQSEDQVFAKADSENTIESWQNFLSLYPQSVFAARARARVIALEKKAAQQAEKDLQARIAQAKKLTLRSDYLSLNQAELNASLQQLGKTGPQFEKMARGSETVIIDFSSGLMWILWNKPMAFDKASWWANRLYAGYSGWRLPTIEETQSLQRMDRALYVGLADFAVWTGDGVSDRPRSMWVLTLPQGQFSPADYTQLFYVWAVRKAVK